MNPVAAVTKTFMHAPVREYFRGLIQFVAAVGFFTWFVKDLVMQCQSADARDADAG
jgi:hypothetical protein